MNFVNKFIGENKKVNILCGIVIIILIIILIVSFVKKDNLEISENGKENGDQEMFYDGNNKKDKYHLYLVVREGCGYARKAYELFNENDMKLKDIPVKVISTDKDDIRKYIGNLESEVDGTPALVCTDSGKVVMGYRTLDEYAQELGLHNVDDFDDVDDDFDFGVDNNKDIIIVGFMKCPFCKKAVDLLEQTVNKDKYRFVDSNETEGKHLLEKHNMNGVPLIIGRNGKVIKGYNEEEIKKLN